MERLKIAVIIPCIDIDPTFDFYLKRAMEYSKDIADFQIYYEKGADLRTSGKDEYGYKWNLERYQLVSDLRNQGIENAKQYNPDFYFIVDDDMELPKNIFEMLNQYRMFPALTPKSISPKGEVYGTSIRQTKIDAFDTHNRFVEMTGNCWIIRRDLMTRLERPYFASTPQSPNEDYYFCHKINALGIKFFWMPIEIYTS
jgi:hypothetical protein